MGRPFKVAPYRSNGKIIGKGSYSTVFKATNEDTGEKVALKTVDLYQLSSREPRKYQKLKDRLKKEIKIAKSIDHPHLVKLIDVLKEDEKIYLVFEFCECGDLSKYLGDTGILDELQAKNFLSQILSGLSYLHGRNIIHRDLKPQNILITKKDGKPHLKIADFGFAKEIEPEDMSATICGSPLYMAPQLLRMDRYSPKADVWSLGVIMYEMITGNKPIEAQSQFELLNNMQTQKITIPGFLSGNCKDLLKGVLRKEESRRLNLEEILLHPFFDAKEITIVPTKTQSSPRIQVPPKLKQLQALSPETTSSSFPSSSSVELSSSNSVTEPSFPKKKFTKKIHRSYLSHPSPISPSRHAPARFRVLCELFYGVEELQDIATQNTEYNTNTLIYIYMCCLTMIEDIIGGVSDIIKTDAQFKIPDKIFKMVDKCIYRYEQIRLAVFQLKPHIVETDTAPSLIAIITQNIFDLEARADDPKTAPNRAYNYIQTIIILLIFMQKQTYFEVNRDSVNKEITRFLKKKRCLKKRGFGSSSSIKL